MGNIPGPLYVEDGIVKRLRGDKEFSLWVDCPDHGREPPALQELKTPFEDHILLGIRWDSGYWATPPRAQAHCGKVGIFHTIKILKRGRGKCDQRCLNGTKECNCQCQGLCHGQGVCRCTNWSRGDAMLPRAASQVLTAALNEEEKELRELKGAE